MSSNPITIRNLGPEDAQILDRVRPGTFSSLDPSRAWGLLATRVNELVVALEQGEVVGFVYGTMLMRPDKPSVFFVQEIGVNAAYRRRGIGRRLMARVTDLAMDRGCERVFLMAEPDNAEARAFFASLEGEERGSHVVYDWPL